MTRWSTAAADFHGYASAYASDPLLAGFRASPHGQAVSQLVARIRQELDRKVTSGLWFVGRRSPFRYEKPTGVQPATSRGELYAFDRETRRYVRLTHTGHQVAGFVRSRGGNEVAVLGFDRVDRPADDAPALIARAWVRTFETTTWTPSSERVTFGPARAIAAHYAEGDQLLVGAAPAADRWTLGTWTVSSLDRSGGALTKVTTPLGAPRIELTLEQGRRITTGGDAVKATWTGEPARAPELSFGSTTIVVPESGLAAQESVALAPDGAYLAFSTAVDPCATDTAPSLYVAHGKTGALKHLLTSNSRFATRWLDATTLAYEDGDGALRLWDSTTGREAMRLENKPGVALEVLSMASAPLCTQAPPAAEPPAAGGSADEMPPEEPAGGPTAAPQ